MPRRSICAEFCHTSWILHIDYADVFNSAMRISVKKHCQGRENPWQIILISLISVIYDNIPDYIQFPTADRIVILQINIANTSSLYTTVIWPDVWTALISSLLNHIELFLLVDWMFELQSSVDCMLNHIELFLLVDWMFELLSSVDCMINQTEHFHKTPH